MNPNSASKPISQKGVLKFVTAVLFIAVLIYLWFSFSSSLRYLQEDQMRSYVLLIVLVYTNLWLFFSWKKARKQDAT